MANNILAFTGRSYVGKDFCGQLVMDMDPRFHSVSFAELPRIEFAELMGIDAEDLATPKVKEKYRVAFQDFCEGKKKESGDKAYWAKRLFTLLEHIDSVVITDLRFIEELTLVIQNKGVVYKVQANPEVRKARGWVPNPYVDNHISQTEMDLSPYTFWQLTKGGGLFNNELEGDSIIRGQVHKLLNSHFPMSLGV